MRVIQTRRGNAVKGDTQMRKGHLQDIAEEYYDDIYRFCAYQVGSREDAYDLAQETFLRFIRYAEGYHDRNLKGYLLTIAMNVCRNHMAAQIKSSGRDDSMEEMSEKADSKQHCPDSSEPERRMLESDLRNRLMEALAILPDIQRETILLHYLYGLKYQEIGKRMGVSVSTVKSRARQGIDKLRGLLREEDF